VAERQTHQLEQNPSKLHAFLKHERQVAALAAGIRYVAGYGWTFGWPR
jgi:hypothetical protein